MSPCDSFHSSLAQSGPLACLTSCYLSRQWGFGDIWSSAPVTALEGGVLSVTPRSEDSVTEHGIEIGSEVPVIGVVES